MARAGAVGLDLTAVGMACSRTTVSPRPNPLPSKLAAAGLIRHARGRITVLDRAGLEQRACECYGVVSNEYDRLLSERAAA